MSGYVEQFDVSCRLTFLVVATRLISRDSPHARPRQMRGVLTASSMKPCAEN